MHIVHELGKTLSTISREMSHEDLEFDVSVSSNSSQGDITTNIALVHFKKLGFNSPREAALAIAAEIDAMHNSSIEKIEIAGPGFVNFYLSKKYLFEMLQKTTQNEKEVFQLDTKSSQKIVVEYSSPNIAKPFTVGHLRSTIIGGALANLLEATGAKVFRDNHLGDWGTQFGKQIYAIKTWGNEEEIENSENPVKELVKLYVKFHEEAELHPEIEEEGRQWFVKLEKGDTEAKRLWEKCIQWSFKEFDRLYQMMGVTFTENDGRGYGESFFEDKMQSVIDELHQKNLLKQDAGAELVYFPNDKYPPLMILKKDGSTLYATRDLATDKFRLETYGKDVIIVNEVGIEQELYFRQLFELEKMLGWVKDGQRIHIKHGHYRFSDGKMSTRKGNVIWLEDVLDEAQKRAENLSKHESESEGLHANDSSKISIGALKWNDLKRDSKQDITFDWDDILNMQGNSGPYLQYTYVRTRSVLQKAAGEKSGERSQETGENVALETEELELLRFLSQYEYHLEAAADSYAPNLLTNYLFELSQKFNLFYQKCKIIGSDNEDFRLSLTQAVGVTLHHGLSILGIETVEKM